MVEVTGSTYSRTIVIALSDNNAETDWIEEPDNESQLYVNACADKNNNSSSGVGASEKEEQNNGNANDDEIEIGKCMFLFFDFKMMK